MDGPRRRLPHAGDAYLTLMDEQHFCEADRVFLKTCREQGGEFQIVVCRQGVEEPDAGALRAHAETMVARGYLERLIVSGTRSRMQGAALYVTFKARPVALALLEALERIEGLEAELEGRKPVSRRSSARRSRALPA